MSLDSANIHVERGGGHGPLLVMIHGLGATAGVWRPMLDRAAEHWPGRWIAVDLPGHGRSAPLESYDLAEYGTALRPLVTGSDVILGHSLGGGIAASLAARIALHAVFALGVKIDWTDAEQARFRELATKPARRFESEEDATRFHARLAGLDHADARSPLLARGVRREQGHWTSALDPRAFAVSPPDMTHLVQSARCPVHLACGEYDPMISVERLRDFDRNAVAIAGAGHNAMVDSPLAVWDWIRAPR